VLSSRSLSVGVLVTSYNAPEQTARSLDAVLRESNGHVEQIVVVDDASTPPFAYADARVVVIRNTENLGYVESVNRGFAAMTTDIVVLLDCDAYVNQLGLAGFTLQNEAGQPTGSCDNEPTVWSLVLGQRLYAWTQKWRACRDSRVYFSCAIAVRRECFFELGGFDPRFDFLDADIDFSMRVNRSRWHTRVGDGLRAVHEGSGSPQSTSQRVVRFYVNRYELLRKHELLGNPVLAQAGVLIRTAAELFLLNTVLLLDRSARRSQQRRSRREVFRHFLDLRRRPTPCARVKRAELGWFYSTALACIHRACRAIRRVLPRFQVMCRVKLRSLPHSFYVRLGTTDYNCLHQVFFQRDYDLPYAIDSLGEVHIVDAGANAGYTSIFYKQHFPNSHIISIEPDHENFRLARRNLLPYPRCTVVNAALWDRNAELVPCEGNWGSGGEWARQVREAHVENGRLPQNRVPGLRLVDLFHRYDLPGIAILKMDIEGAEHQVIRSCDGATLSLIENAAIEFHGGDPTARQWLLENGFREETSGETTLFTRASSIPVVESGSFDNTHRRMPESAVAKP
jgi:FkbM family methyltransferase